MGSGAVNLPALCLKHPRVEVRLIALVVLLLAPEALLRHRWHGKQLTPERRIILPRQDSPHRIEHNTN